MIKNQFTGTSTQSHRNQQSCHFYNDQYCMTP